MSIYSRQFALAPGCPWEKGRGPISASQAKKTEHVADTEHVGEFRGVGEFPQQTTTLDEVIVDTALHTSRVAPKKTD